jgi:hypothetical protein
VDDDGRNEAGGWTWPGWADVAAAQAGCGAPPAAGRGPGTASRALGVTAAALTGWRDAFLAAGEAALTSRLGTGEEPATERLKTKLGEALIERDLLREKIVLLEAGRPLAPKRPRR